jgi:hypothetical protein
MAFPFLLVGGIVTAASAVGGFVVSLCNKSAISDLTAEMSSVESTLKANAENEAARFDAAANKILDKQSEIKDSQEAIRNEIRENLKVIKDSQEAMRNEVKDGFKNVKDSQDFIGKANATAAEAMTKIHEAMRGLDTIVASGPRPSVSPGIQIVNVAKDGVKVEEASEEKEVPKA